MIMTGSTGLLDLDVMTAPHSLAELDQALADADTVERVASIHNTAKAAGGVTPEVLWERCSARWDEIERGMDHRKARATTEHIHRW